MPGLYISALRLSWTFYFLFLFFFVKLNNQQQNFYFSIQLLWKALELVKLTVLRIIYDMFTEGFSFQSVGGKGGAGGEKEMYCWKNSVFQCPC